MTFRVVRTNQYNQDLGLIHSTNGNHLDSPKEGSSIDHRVTIYLHAQNITMFPTNETWYFASHILVSNSGGLILILTAQSTRNSSEYTLPDSPTSAGNSPLRFISDDISMADDTTRFSNSITDLQTFLSACIDDSRSDILSKLNTLEKGLSDSLRQQEEAFRTLIHSARQDGRTLDDVQTLRFNEFRKGNLNHITDQLSELIAYINRGGNDKKGEVSSSRPQPPPDDQKRGSGNTGGDNVRTTDIVDRFSGSMSREGQNRGRSGGRRSSGNISGSSKQIHYSSSGGPFKRSFEDCRWYNQSMVCNQSLVSFQQLDYSEEISRWRFSSLVNIFRSLDFYIAKRQRLDKSKGQRLDKLKRQRIGLALGFSGWVLHIIIYWYISHWYFSSWTNQVMKCSGVVTIRYVIFININKERYFKRSTGAYFQELKLSAVALLRK
ncbi:hypothetical protein F511_41978 [Dorcoceras hygrometricum]|uniref:Uncharacterized protein n=1 Tax=Dorcoceras hygrometricum TaxID=472368 RepID=A0A2Z7BZG2_9LAMI|nr:hypothetical protein F511_41978 [Dorcoceras hygrometricum]